MSFIAFCLIAAAVCIALVFGLSLSQAAAEEDRRMEQLRADEWPYDDDPPDPL